MKAPLALAALVAVSSASISAEASERPNVLILYADDWRHDTLGCAGHPVVQTPNLDRLARDGFRFTRACVTTSICGVSRATLLTGQWMSRHGCTSFGMFRTPWEETYPGLLRANGYWAGHVGKWHNGRFPAERFDFARAYGGRHFMKQSDGSTIHVTRKNEEDALEFLRTRPKDKPFCLTVAFFATHAEDSNPKQFLPQPESAALYRDATVPVPKTATEEHFRRLPPFLANEKNEGRNRWRWRFDTPEKYQSYMKNYYRLATEVDATCGRLVEELRSQEILDETLVIFTTDNGYFHGEHGLADKWYPYEESIRVPLIVRDPRLPEARRGKTNDEFVLSVDLAPTILSFAGIAAPTTMQGRDFAPLYLDAKPQADAKPPAWREEFFYEHATIRDVDFIPASQALVRKDWKYIRWPDFDHEELFDLRRDPHEERDLAGDAAHAGTLERLREAFRQAQAAAR
ncbi:MAG: sulfatase [Planctomycetales bacterium]